MANVSELVSQMQETLSSIHETISLLHVEGHEAKLDELEEHHQAALAALHTTFGLESDGISKKRQTQLAQIADQRQREDDERKAQRQREDNELQVQDAQQDSDRQIKLKHDEDELGESTDALIATVEDAAEKAIEEGKAKLSILEEKRKELNRRIDEQLQIPLPTVPRRRKNRAVATVSAPVLVDPADKHSEREYHGDGDRDALPATVTVKEAIAFETAPSVISNVVAAESESKVGKEATQPLARFVPQQEGAVETSPETVENHKPMQGETPVHSSTLIETTKEITTPDVLNLSGGNTQPPTVELQHDTPDIALLPTEKPDSVSGQPEQSSGTTIPIESHEEEDLQQTTVAVDGSEGSAANHDVQTESQIPAVCELENEPCAEVRPHDDNNLRDQLEGKADIAVQSLASVEEPVPEHAAAQISESVNDSAGDPTPKQTSPEEATEAVATTPVTASAVETVNDQAEESLAEQITTAPAEPMTEPEAATVAAPETELASPAIQEVESAQPARIDVQLAYGGVLSPDHPSHMETHANEGAQNEETLHAANENPTGEQAFAAANGSTGHSMKADVLEPMRAPTTESGHSDVATNVPMHDDSQPAEDHGITKVTAHEPVAEKVLDVPVIAKDSIIYPVTVAQDHPEQCPAPRETAQADASIEHSASYYGTAEQNIYLQPTIYITPGTPTLNSELVLQHEVVDVAKQDSAAQADMAQYDIEANHEIEAPEELKKEVDQQESANKVEEAALVENAATVSGQEVLFEEDSEGSAGQGHGEGNIRMPLQHVQHVHTLADEITGIPEMPRTVALSPNVPMDNVDEAPGEQKLPQQEPEKSLGYQRPATPEADDFSEPPRMATANEAKHVQTVPSTPPRPAPGRAEWETPAYSVADANEAVLSTPRDIAHIARQAQGIEMTPESVCSETAQWTASTGSSYDGHSSLDEPFVRRSWSSTPESAPQARLSYGHVVAVDENGLAIEAAPPRQSWVPTQSRPGSVTASTAASVSLFQKMRSMFEPPDAAIMAPRRDSISSSTSQLTTPGLKQAMQLPHVSVNIEDGDQDEDDEADVTISERSGLLQAAVIGTPANY